MVEQRLDPASVSAMDVDVPVTVPAAAAWPLDASAALIRLASFAVHSLSHLNAGRSAGGGWSVGGNRSDSSRPTIRVAIAWRVSVAVGCCATKRP